MKALCKEYNLLPGSRPAISINDISSAVGFSQPSVIQENHHLLDTYFMLERSKEEIEFVKQEMKSALAFFQQQLTILQHLEIEYPDFNGYLCMKQHKVEIIIKQLNVMFSPHVPISEEFPSLSSAEEESDEDMEYPEWDPSVLVEIYDIDKYCNDEDYDSN